MIPWLSTSRLTLSLLLLLCILQQGCSLTGQTGTATKSGLYVDAVLEFVVEYPITWHKDRRLQYGRAEGEVRWTNPEHPEMLLIINSTLQKQQTTSFEQRLDTIVKEFGDLEVTSKELVTLPDGEAWHLTGNRSRTRVDIYMPVDTRRNYRVSLVSALEHAEGYEHIMQKVMESFHRLP
jgi:hypothetical protein